MAHTARPKHIPSPSTHPLEDHPEYVQAIGMVALETIALEIRLATLLARMLGLPPRIGQAIYLSPKSEASRLDILRNTAKSWLSVSPSKRNSALGKQKLKALSDVLSLHDRALALVRKRHGVIHNEWNYSDMEKTVTRKVIDGHPGHQRQSVKKDEVGRLIQEIRLLIDDAYDLTEAFRIHPPVMIDLARNPKPSPLTTTPRQIPADRPKKSKLTESGPP